MSNEAVTPEEVARHVHPKDRRVILTPRMDIFIAAARNHSEYRAVILQRDTAFKVRLTKEFQTVARTLRPEFIMLDANASASGAKIQSPSPSEFPDFVLVQKELEEMTAIYHQLTGMPQIGMVFARVIMTHAMHHHTFSVLNCNWLSEGTAWKNETGNTLRADRGDLLFIKDGFLHEASFDKESESNSARTLIAVLPREYTY
jgi:hypothetical protein